MKKRNMWGLVLIVLAFYLMGEMLGFFTNMPGLFTIVLTVLLVSVSLSNIPKLDFFGIILPLAIVLIMYDKQILNQVLTSWNKWTIMFAAILLSSGLKMIFKQQRKAIKYSKNDKFTGGKEYSFTFGDDDDDDEKRETPRSSRSKGDDHVSVSASFSGRTRYVRSDNFSYAQLECNFGSIDIYFDEAEFNPDGSEINVDCNFGAIKIYLPKTINVDNRVEVTFGANGDETPSYVQGAPIVRISGEVNMGAIEIVYI